MGKSDAEGQLLPMALCMLNPQRFAFPYSYFYWVLFTFLHQRAQIRALLDCIFCDTSQRGPSEPQEDVDWFLWEAHNYPWGTQSYRLRAETRQTEDAKRARGQEDRAMKIPGPARAGLPVGAGPHTSNSPGFPRDTSEVPGLRRAQSQCQIWPQIPDCSSYAAVPLMS